jgi:hypothetical protein
LRNWSDPDGWGCGWRNDSVVKKGAAACYVFKQRWVGTL